MNQRAGRGHEDARPMYTDGSWRQMKLGRAGARHASEFDPKETDWLRRWTFYAELMSLVRDRDAEALQSREPRLFSEIDAAQLGHGKESKDRLRENFKNILGSLCEDASDEGPHALARHALQAIHAWRCYMIRDTETSAAGEWKKATKPTGKKDGGIRDARKVMVARLWREGLDAPEAFEIGAAPGLELITERLDRFFEPWRSRPPGVGEQDLLGELDATLPAPLADKVRESVGKMRGYRAELQASGVAEDFGIDEQGFTELLRESIVQFMRQGDGKGTPMLLLGPTTSGKSHIGRIAASRVVHAHNKVIVLLPTKALVTQAVDEWNDFLQDTDLGWKILPGSRDYPENDEELVRGEYQVAILIPEKLSGLMATGMNLSECGLLIVDELQHLTDPQRGPKLEMLLTSLRATRPDIPVLGLSATLSQDAADTIRLWLGVPSEAVVSVQRRPVPLDVMVCDDVHAQGVSSSGSPIRERNLRPLLNSWDQKIKRDLEPVRAYKRALALAITLLKEEKQVLCFVGSRGDAERLAAAAQIALRVDTDVTSVPLGAEAYAGRFGGALPDAAELQDAFDRFPRTELRESVGEALRSGVGYHTARLEPQLRTVVEAGFRGGCIRLLFATDTLKLGLNLPADAVVIGSITTPAGGRRQRVLDQEAVAQRMGRAGRLLHSLHGEGFLVLPGSSPSRDRAEFGKAELEGLAALAAQPGTGEPDLDRALRALLDIEAVSRYYVHAESAGTSVSSKLNQESFAALVLQRIVRQQTFTRDSLQEQAMALREQSLAAVCGPENPDIGTAIGLLESRELIGPSPREAGQLTVTGLGRAMSASGLPFGDVARVQELVEACRKGAGDLTLLWVAAQSQHVKASSGWVSIAPMEGGENVEDQLKRAVLDLAGAFAATSTERTEQAQKLRYHTFEGELPTDDLVGTGTSADQLRALISGGGADLERVNALLRACVLLLWMNGCPLATLEKTITRNVAAQVNARGHQATRSVQIHTADVRTLGENISYLFDAAADLMAVRPDGTGFRRLEAISQSVEAGVPLPLVPLARLRMAATHRERIVHLKPHLGAAFADLTDLVEKMMKDPGAVTSSAPAKAKARALAVSDGERHEMCTRLKEQEDRRRYHSSQLRARYQGQRIPGLSAGDTFGAVVQTLTHQRPDVAARTAAGVLQACGVSVEQSDGGRPVLVLTSQNEPARVARMLVEGEQVTKRRLIDAAGQAQVILAQKGITAWTAACAGPSGSGLVVVEPAIFLELVARLLDVEGQLESDNEDQEEWMQPEGMEHVGHCLLQLLLAAPPMLTRKDVSRLIAGRTVGAPPPLASGPAATP